MDRFPQPRDSTALLQGDDFGLKIFALLAEIAQLTFQPLRDLVGCCEFRLQGIVDQRLNEMIDHGSRDLRIAIGVVHFDRRVPAMTLTFRLKSSLGIFRRPGESSRLAFTGSAGPRGLTSPITHLTGLKCGLKFSFCSRLSSLTTLSARACDCKISACV